MFRIHESLRVQSIRKILDHVIFVRVVYKMCIKRAHGTLGVSTWLTDCKMAMVRGAVVCLLLDRCKMAIVRGVRFLDGAGA